VTALDSLSLMGYPKEDPDIKKALSWLVKNQLPNGLWKLTYFKKTVKTENSSVKSREGCLWLTLTISKIFKRLYRDNC